MDSCLRLVNGQLSQQVRVEQAQPSVSADGSLYKAPTAATQNTLTQAVSSGLGAPGEGSQALHGISVGILRWAMMAHHKSLDDKTKLQSDS